MSDINNRAVLAKLTVSQWSGRKKDRDVSQRVTSEAKADPATGAFYKKLAQSHLFSEFSRIAQSARIYHNSVTLPWLDGGYRLLPTDLFFDYQEQMRKYRDQGRDVAQQIRDEFPRMMRAAQASLGSLYNEDDFPSPDQVERKFGIEVNLVPVPDVEDFRLDLDAESQEQIRDEVRQSYSEMQRQAVNDLWQRLYGVVEHMATRLHEVDKAERKRLHESIVTHVRDLVEVLPSLNITGDSELDSLTREAKDKLLVDINSLRTSPDTRAATANAADDLLARITGTMQQR